MVGSPMRGDRDLQPKISPEELERMKVDLGVDETQGTLIGAAYEGYQNAVQVAAKPLRDQKPMVFQSESGKIDQEAIKKRFAEMQAPAQTFRTERDRLQSEFLDSVHRLLSADQQSSWNHYRKGLTRRTTLSQRAALPGEGVDLVELAHSLVLSDSKAHSLEVILNQYETELDDALRDRNTLLDEVEALMRPFDPMSGVGLGSDAKDQSLLDQSTKKRLNVVAVNNRYVSTIASSLDQETGKSFRSAFDLASFPRIFNPTRADRYIKKLDENEVLTPAQRPSVDLVVTDYRQNLRQVNRRLVDLEWQKQADIRARVHQSADNPPTNREERRIAVQSIGGRSSIMLNPHGSPETEDRIRDARKQKGDLVNNTIDALFATLSPDQQTKYPKPTRINRFARGNLGQYLGDNAVFQIDDSDLPPGFDRERLTELLQNTLDNIEVDFGDGAVGDVQISTVSIASGADGEGGEAVAVAVVLTADEEGDDDGSTAEEEEGDGGGGGI